MTGVLALRGAVGRDGRPVLDDVDLHFGAGELTAIVGPNGTGKSTLLATLAGDLPPLHGEVRLRGVALPSLTAREAARRRAVLLQQHVVAFPFTARQVVQMGRSPWTGTDAQADDARVVEASLDRCGVAHLADRRVTELSGGERAGVMLARAMAQDTDVLLLDEPAAALDPTRQDEVMLLLRDRARGGATVVVIVHDLTAAAADADRIVLLGGGAVVADGTPAEVMRPDLLTAAYGAPMHVLTDPSSGRLIVLPARGQTTAQPARGQRAAQPAREQQAVQPASVHQLTDPARHTPAGHRTTA